MDLGLRGKHALVCGASKGLGFACADALAAEGVDVVIVARGAEALEKAAADLRARHGRRVVAVATDITTPEGRKLALDAVARLGERKGGKEGCCRHVCSLVFLMRHAGGRADRRAYGSLAKAASAASAGSAPAPPRPLPPAAARRGRRPQPLPLFAYNGSRPARAASGGARRVPSSPPPCPHPHFPASRLPRSPLPSHPPSAAASPWPPSAPCCFPARPSSPS